GNYPTSSQKNGTVHERWMHLRPCRLMILPLRLPPPSPSCRGWSRQRFSEKNLRLGGQFRQLMEDIMERGTPNNKGKAMPSLTHNLLSYLRAVAGAWRDDSREDAELMARFAEDGDEAAFKALVWRHGPLVWRSCTRVLGDGPDAEDAFQITFLAL